MDRFDRTFGWAFAVMTFVVLAFWFIAIYVAVHFLAKVW